MVQHNPNKINDHRVSMLDAPTVQCTINIEAIDCPWVACVLRPLVLWLRVLQPRRLKQKKVLIPPIVDVLPVVPLLSCCRVQVVATRVINSAVTTGRPHRWICWHLQSFEPTTACQEWNTTLDLLETHDLQFVAIQSTSWARINNRF